MNVTTNGECAWKLRKFDSLSKMFWQLYANLKCIHFQRESLSSSTFKCMNRDLDLDSHEITRNDQNRNMHEARGRTIPDFL
jgi:hypothetical protein